MNFRKRVTKSGKRTSCFYGLSWQQRKQYTSNIGKKVFKRSSDTYVSTGNISIEVVVQELGGGGVTQPPFGSRCGSKTPWAGEG